MLAKSAINYRLYEVRKLFTMKYGIEPNAIIMSIDTIKQFESETTMVEVPEAIAFKKQALALGIELSEYFGIKIVINGLSVLPIEGPPNTIQICLI